MTVPRFLQSTFHFNSDLAVTDMANAITSLTTILTTQVPAWTNPSAGVLVSPVDSAGRFMKLTMDSPIPARLRMLLQDQNGIGVSFRSIELIPGPLPTTINYFTGQYHCYIESLTGGSSVGEWLGAMMVDPTDYDLVDLQNFVIGGGSRNSGGANDGQGTVCDQWFMLENGTSTLRQRARLVSQIVGVTIGLVDFAGNPQFFPFDVGGNPNGTLCWMGSMYQTYVTHSGIGGGIIKPVAIDNATPAQFRSTVAPSTAQGLRMMLRVP